MTVDAARGSEEGFTSAGATRVMVAACRAAGLDDRGAELIRLGENALFRLVSLSGRGVVRVAGRLDAVDRLVVLLEAAPGGKDDVA
jgi:hypothetical protein